MKNVLRLKQIITIYFFIMKSFFKFQITQTVQVLLYKVKNGDGRRWLVEQSEDNPQQILLHEINRPENTAVLTCCTNDCLKIVTACGGYEYIVQNLPGDGAEVSFAGPVNALLAQALMPRMRYVPGTLLAMSEDMEDFAPIQEFLEVRRLRNLENPNPQDKHAWRINMKFNNELFPYFPPFVGQMRDKKLKKKKFH